MIYLDVNDIYHDNSINLLIVESKTGVIYTDQVGGYLCAHPEVEGFIFPFYCNLSYEDCERGACAMNIYDDVESYENDSPDEREKDARERVGEELNKQFKLIDYPAEDFFGCSYISSLSFDFERIYKLTESFWPVTIEISRKLDGAWYGPRGRRGYEKEYFKGFLLNRSNCD